MKTALMFSSKKDDWETPWSLFDELSHEFHFTLDVCATINNTKCIKFFSPKDDGLIQSWKGEVCWMNPPYGRMISKWTRKAYEESRGGGARRGTIACKDGYTLVS
ncbi:MAG: hypothetical protein SAMD01599839_08190 [Rectinema sp.]